MEEIQQLRDRLLQKLEEESDFILYFQKFERFVHVHHKVNYMKELLQQFGLLDEFMLGKQLCIPKQVDLCQRYLEQAYEVISQPEQRVLALSLLNRAICCANEEAEPLLAQVYSLKATIYQERGDYKKAFDVIRKGLNCRDCPAQLQVGLTVKGMECSTWINDDGAKTERVEEEYTLSHDPHEEFPLLSCKLNPLSTDGPNNYKIYTTGNIKEDEVIAIDQPICLHVIGNHRFYVCYNCTKEVVVPFPCPSCTTVVFCSDICEKAANEGFHGFECNAIDFLSMILDDFYYPALRLTFTYFQIFRPSVKSAMKFFKSRRSKEELFNLDHRNISPLDYYKVINTFDKNPDRDNIVDRMTTALIVAVISHVLFDHTSLKDYLTSQRDKNFFVDLFYYHIEIAPHNLEAVTKELDNLNGRKSVEVVGMGLYGLQKYLPWSLQPNVRKVFSGQNCAYISNIDIPGGHVLCSEPLIFEISENEKSSPVINEKILDNSLDYCDFYEIPRRLSLRDNIKLFFRNREFAVTVMGCCAVLLEEFEDFYPCYQLMTAEHAFWLAVNIFLDSIPVDQRVDVPYF